ncbi:hypothetical protein QQ045_002505 [Rhodiola kirilowii]
MGTQNKDSRHRIVYISFVSPVDATKVQFGFNMTVCFPVLLKAAVSISASNYITIFYTHYLVHLEVNKHHCRKVHAAFVSGSHFVSFSFPSLMDKTLLKNVMRFH